MDSERDPVARARGTAVRWLARRALTERELRDRFARTDHPSDAVEAAIGHAAERGWLDDARIAENHVRRRARSRGLGPARLRAELLARGVDEAEAERALADVGSEGDVDFDAILAREVEKRTVRLGERLDRAGLARVYHALVRRGFAPGDVRAALAPHFDRIDDDATGRGPDRDDP